MSQVKSEPKFSWPCSLKYAPSITNLIHLYNTVFFLREEEKFFLKFFWGEVALNLDLTLWQYRSSLRGEKIKQKFKLQVWWHIAHFYYLFLFPFLRTMYVVERMLDLESEETWVQIPLNGLLAESNRDTTS